MTRTRTSLEASREALLQAGEELVREDARVHSEAVDGALAHVNVAEVARRAGLSKGMIYYIWESQGDFRTELLHRLARSTTTESFVATVDTAIMDQFATFDETVDALARLTLDQAMTDGQWFTFMEVSTYVANPEVRAAMDEGQQRALEATSALYREALAHWDRELRDGVTVEQVVLLTRAFSRGVTMQSQVDPRLFESTVTCSGREMTLYLSGVRALIDAYVLPATD